MPRFVILEHDWPTRHWDLLLEAGDVLRAWRLTAEPAVGAVIPAEPNADHRLFYLDYEGPVSDGRGTVTRWATGVFAWAGGGRQHATLEMASGRVVGQASLDLKGNRWEFRVS